MNGHIPPKPRIRRLLFSAASMFALLATTDAGAATMPDGEIVAARACLGKKDNPVTQADLAEALLIEAGVSPAQFLKGAPIPASSDEDGVQGAYRRALLKTFFEIRARELNGPSGNHPSDPGGELSEGILNVEQILQNGSDNIAVSPPGTRDITLFLEAAPAWSLTCKTGEATESVVKTLEKRTPPPRFALREKPEELWLGGKAGRKAGAFKLGFERTRTLLEDGTRKTDTSFSIAGTAGYLVSRGRTSGRDAYLFAQYALNQARTRPRPVLAPGEKESDGDTHVLSLGIDGSFHADLPTLPIDLNLQAATVLDFANHSERIKLKALATPGFDKDIGLCRLGSFSSGSLRRRCGLAAEVEAAHMLRRGTSDLTDHDTFLAVGGRASFELFLPTSGDDTGFLASAKYRFLPVVRGKPDDIERLDIELKHRFWTDAGAGIDVGFTYTKGTNELSFEEEDVLTFGLGIIF